MRIYFPAASFAKKFFLVFLSFSIIIGAIYPAFAEGKRISDSSPSSNENRIDRIGQYIDRELDPRVEVADTWLSKFVKKLLPEKLHPGYERWRAKFWHEQLPGFLSGKLLGVAGAAVGAIIGACIPIPGAALVGATIGFTTFDITGSSIVKRIARERANAKAQGRLPDYSNILKFGVDWKEVSVECTASIAGAFAGEAIGIYYGAMLGAALGNFTLPVVGAIAGPVVGEFVGRRVGRLLAKFALKKGALWGYDRYRKSRTEKTLEEAATSGPPDSCDPALRQAYDNYVAKYRKYVELLSSGRDEEAARFLKEQVIPAKEKYDTFRISQSPAQNQ